jgi:hypothetical protein
MVGRLALKSDSQFIVSCCLHLSAGLVAGQCLAAACLIGNRLKRRQLLTYSVLIDLKVGGRQATPGPPLAICHHDARAGPRFALILIGCCPPLCGVPALNTSAVPGTNSGPGTTLPDLPLRLPAPLDGIVNAMIRKDAPGKLTPVLSG